MSISLSFLSVVRRSETILVNLLEIVFEARLSRIHVHQDVSSSMLRSDTALDRYEITVPLRKKNVSDIIQSIICRG